MTPTERLAFLSRALREWEQRAPEVGVRFFEMGQWLHLSPECGTAACAVGFATQLPELQAEGLGVSPMGHGDFEPEFDGELDLGAAERFFGLTWTQAKFLFIPSRYDTRRITPTDVADRIDALFAERARS